MLIGQMLFAAQLASIAPTVADQSVAASADQQASAQSDIALTIYNDDLALVEDRRTIDLPAGRSRQEFTEVSAQIRPETATLTGSGIGVVEQNFDFDLLTPEKLMAKTVGRTVTLVRTDPVTRAETREEARVLANNNGTIVQAGSRIEVLDRMNSRVIFSSLPSNLRARPTLSVTLEAAQPGARPVTLSYLSRGLGWKADYIALFDEAVGKIDVQGWVTLNNNSGTTFSRANAMLVAGAVAQVGVRGDARTQALPRTAAGTESDGRERLGDFHVYPLAERTTIADAQQKQVSFLDTSGTPATRGYRYRNPWLGRRDDAASADTVLSFSSSREGGLGDALPAGIVRVYMRDARGKARFVGESQIGHTPMGSQLALKTGQAFDLKVQPTVEKRERLAGDKWRTTMRYRVTNARDTAATVDLVQAGLDGWQDSRIESETLQSERRNADEALWRVAVPANGEAVVTATFVTRY